MIRSLTKFLISIPEFFHILYNPENKKICCSLKISIANRKIKLYKLMMFIKFNELICGIMAILFLDLIICQHNRYSVIDQL